MTLYGVRVISISNNAVVHNLKPAKRGAGIATTDVGLYDEITGTFYPNAGANPFELPG